MDDGADGGGAFHGVGQPDVQREHGGLAPAAGEEKDGADGEGIGGEEPEQDGVIEGGGGFGAVQHGEVEAADDVADDDDAKEEEGVGEAGE